MNHSFVENLTRINADGIELSIDYPLLFTQEILHVIKASGMVLEINTSGLRKPVAELYPSSAILQEAYHLDIPITFGSDAHSTAQVGAGLQEAYALAKSIGYTKAVTFRNRQREMIKI